MNKNNFTHIGSDQVPIFIGTWQKERFGELVAVTHLDSVMTNELSLYLGRVDAFLQRQYAEGRRMLKTDPVGRDSIVMEHPDYPDRIRKRYRNLSKHELDSYYVLLADFQEWLHTQAPAERMRFGRWNQKFMVHPTHMHTVSPTYDLIDGIGDYEMDSDFKRYTCDLPKITGVPVENGRFTNECDYLFGLFLEQTYGKLLEVEMFFPYKSLKDPLPMFQAPNIQRVDDEYFLTDVNRIKHVARTILQATEKPTI